MDALLANKGSGERDWNSLDLTKAEKRKGGGGYMMTPPQLQDYNHGYGATSSLTTRNSTRQGDAGFEYKYRKDENLQTLS